MLKLKLQNFGYLMQRTDSSEKTLMLGKTEGGREGDDRGRDGITDSMDMSLSNHRELVISGQGSLVCCSPWGRKGQHLEKQRHYFDDKGPSSQSYGFSSSHVWM